MRRFPLLIVRMNIPTLFRTLLLLTPLSVLAQWPDRHGPDHNSIVPAASAKGLPTSWSATENIAWRTPLHDEGHSSPVVGEGKVWLTAATKDGTKQSVIARLESADYEGHSLSMLVRVAAALGNRIEISLVPRDETRRTG